MRSCDGSRDHHRSMRDKTAFEFDYLICIHSVIPSKEVGKKSNPPRVSVFS